MEWLNYHHLLYFWTVARTGSIAKAAQELRLSTPTISAQIHQLEQQLGEKLLRREGTRLVLTPAGQIAMPYAEAIFSSGKQLSKALKGSSLSGPLKLNFGIVPYLPKWLVYRVIEPALHLPRALKLDCKMDRLEHLLDALALHELDMILTDTPAKPATEYRIFNHLLGECAASFYAVPKLVQSYKRGFPRSLNDAPLLLVENGSYGHLELDRWFAANSIVPNVVGRFEDFSTIRVFAEAGFGVIVAPSIIDKELEQSAGLHQLARVDVLRYGFYAVSLERKIAHPAVNLICESSRAHLFAQSPTLKIHA